MSDRQHVMEEAFRLAHFGASKPMIAGYLRGRIDGEEAVELSMAAERLREAADAIAEEIARCAEPQPRGGPME